MQSFTIGRVAAGADVNLETAHYYERIKLMSSPARTASGHRACEEGRVRRLAFIRRARELGFSINQIRALLALAEPPRASCLEVRAKLADLARLEGILAETIARCCGDSAPPCPVLDMLAKQDYA
jgi:MerR family mercuric resistance operon transcriptional regulator